MKDEANQVSATFGITSVKSVVIVARSARIAGLAELSLSYFHVTINPHFLLCRLLPRDL